MRDNRHGPRLVEWSGTGKLGELNLEDIALPAVEMLQANLALTQLSDEGAEVGTRRRRAKVHSRCSQAGVGR